MKHVYFFFFFNSISFHIIHSYNFDKWKYIPILCLYTWIELTQTYSIITKRNSTTVVPLNRKTLLWRNLYCNIILFMLKRDHAFWPDFPSNKDVNNVNFGVLLAVKKEKKKCKCKYFHFWSIVFVFVVQHVGIHYCYCSNDNKNKQEFYMCFWVREENCV